jgi:predicted nucleic acid-binding Zn ribbon protein
MEPERAIVGRDCVACGEWYPTNEMVGSYCRGCTADGRKEEIVREFPGQLVSHWTPGIAKRAYSDTSTGHPCKMCGTPIFGSSKKRYCSSECKIQAQLLRYRPRLDAKRIN